jgi:Zn finger protein HypA/HybF involved in hydrogenase expression
MHEIAISETICKTIEREAKRLCMSKVKIAKLKIGIMNAFDVSNLKLCLAGYKNNPMMADIIFTIEPVPVEIECIKCRRSFIDERFADHDFAHRTAHAPMLYLPPPCPACNTESGKIISGNEMELISIE